MELVAVFVLFCPTSALDASCEQQIITDQAKNIECVMKAPEYIAGWLHDNPKYAGWRVANWGCVRNMQRRTAT